MEVTQRDVRQSSVEPGGRRVIVFVLALECLKNDHNLTFYFGYLKMATIGRPHSSVVEHLLGKKGVVSSTLTVGLC